MIITSGVDTLQQLVTTISPKYVVLLLFDTTVSWEETDRDIQLASYQSKFSLRVMPQNGKQTLLHPGFFHSSTTSKIHQAKQCVSLLPWTVLRFLTSTAVLNRELPQITAVTEVSRLQHPHVEIGFKSRVVAIFSVKQWQHLIPR